MKAQPITKQQVGIIGTICSKLQIKGDEKQAMVSGFSLGRCSSSKDLTHEEASAMIKHLVAIQGDDNNSQAKTKMIGKIFYYAHEMRWTKVNGAGKTVADGKRVDEWMTSHSYLKKKLEQYSYKELPKLVSQFAQVYKSFLNKI